MPILLKTITAPTVTTDETTGVVTISGTPSTKTFLEGAGDILTMPFKLTDDTVYYNGGMAASAVLVWSAGLFHVSDYIHAKRGAQAISPITRMITNQ